MGFLENASDSWHSLLDSLNEKGIPLKSISDYLEEKGIPSLPVFLILLALIVYAIASMGVPALGASTGSVEVSVRAADGSPLAGVTVALESGEGDYTDELATDASGKALFSGVPVGTAMVRVTSDDYFFETGYHTADVVASETVSLSDSAFPTESRVSLYYSVEGPDNADVYLLDAVTGAELAHATTYAGSFLVDPENEYVLRAVAPGYSTVEESVNVGTTSQPPVSLVLVEVGGAQTAKLHLQVLGENKLALANATVVMRLADTGGLLVEAITGADGRTPMQTVALASSLSLTASADGYLPETRIVNVTERDYWPLPFNLVKGDALTSSLVRIRVRNAAGDAVNSPSILLYSPDSPNAAKYEAAPFGGTAEFVVPASEASESQSALSGTVFKPGFLPAFLPVVPAGETLVTLSPATPEASGLVSLSVTDYYGYAVAGASVALFDSVGQPLGLPAKITGVDGTQSFEGVPLGDVVAVASMAGNVAASEPFAVESATENPYGSSATISFPLAKATVLFTVTSRYSNAPGVPGAAITLTASDGETYSCTTNAAGACSIIAVEGEATASVNADGFESFSSAALQLIGGADNANAFQLAPEGLEEQARLDFAGLYDLDGTRVASVQPYTTYNAKYVLTAPTAGGFSFERATAFVRIAGDALSADASAITAYSAPGAGVRRGSTALEAQTGSAEQGAPSSATVYFDEYGFAPADVQVAEGATVEFVNIGSGAQTISVKGEFDGVAIAANNSFDYQFLDSGDYALASTEYPENAGSIEVLPVITEDAVAAEESGAAFKWVEFEYSSFTGSREITVQVRTGAPQDALAFEQRTAFYSGDEVLRDPSDSEAGVTKDESLALTRESASFENSFQGSCVAGLCYRFAFSSASGSSASFQAALGQEFKAHYYVYGEPGAQYALVASVEPPTLSFDGAPSASAALALDESGRASGYFTLSSARLSEDSPVSFALNDANNDPVAQETLSVRVVAENEPRLKVTVSPASLVALEEYALAFTVNDEYGYPVEDASITLSGSVLASPLSAVQDATQPGLYTIELQPTGAGTLNFEVTAPSFKRYTGRLNVKAPALLLVASPASLQLSLDSFEGASAEFALANALSNRVTVTASIYTEDNPEYSEIFLYDGFYRLEGNAEITGSLNAEYAKSVQLYSNNPRTLREETTGFVRFRARLGSVTQTIEIPFTTRTTFTQQLLEDAWTVSSDELEFQLESTESRETLALTVSNLGDQALLINQEDSSSALSVTPASLVLEAGESADFAVTAALGSAATDCMDTLDSTEASLSLYASFQGERSTRVLPVSVTIAGEAPCLPENGYSVSLPLDSAFALPSGYRYKENGDGSTTIQPFGKGGEIFAVQPGAYIRQSVLEVSSETGIVLPASWVSRTSDGWRITIPLQATIYLTDDTSATQALDGSISIELYGGTLSMSPGATLSSSGGRSSVIVPASNPITYAPTDCSQIYSSFPSNSRELRLPVEAVFYPVRGSSVNDNEDEQCPNPPSAYPSASYAFLQSNNLLKLPDGRTIALPGEAEVENAADGSIARITIPAGSSVLVPAEMAYQSTESEEAITVSLPFPYQLVYSDDAAEPLRDTEAGTYTIKFDDENAAQFRFNPVPITASGRQTVGVPAYSPVVYLSGASAHEIVDPSIYDSCQQYFSYDEATKVYLPTGTITRTEGGQLSALLPDCSDNSQLLIQTPDGVDIYKSPASKRVVFTDYNLESGELDDYSAKTLSIPRNARVTFYTCSQVEDDLHSATLTVPTPASVVLPQGVWNGDLFTLATPAKINVDFGRKFETGRTKKIEFNPANTEDYSRLENSGGTVSLPAFSSMTYLTVCDSAGRSVEVTANADYLRIYEKETETVYSESNPFELTLTNAQASTGYDLVLCLVNIGDQVLDLTGVTPESGAISANAADYVAAFPTDGMYFDKGERYGPTSTGQIAPLTRECNTYHVKIVVPPNLLNEYTNCIELEEQLVLNGQLLFETRYAGEDGVRAFPVSLTLDPNEVACSGGSGSGTPLDEKVTVNYDPASVFRLDGDPIQFAFKGVGEEHYRYLSITNNREEAVVAQIQGAEYLDCYHLTADGSKGASFVSGESVTAGNALVLRCYSTPAGSGVYKISFTGVESGEEFSKQVTSKVYSGDPAVYSATPLGRVACPDQAKCLPIPETEDGEAAVVGEPQTAYSYADLQLCGNYYCTFSQMASAYGAFLNAELAVLNDGFATEEDYRDYWVAFGNGERPLTRSAVIHMTNTRVSTEQFAKVSEVTQALSQLASGSMGLQGVSTAGVDEEGGLDASLASNFENELQGCGVYVVTASPYLSISTGTVAELRANTLLLVTIKRIASCTPPDDPEPDLANAALLMPPDETLVFTGNDVIPSGIKFSGSVLPLINIGRYGFEDNSDAKTMRALYYALYRIEPEDTAIPSAEPSRYDDKGFCFTTTGGALATSAGTLATGCVAGLAFMGTGNVFAGKLAFSACSGFARAAGCYALPAGSYGSCSQTNRCLNLAFASLAESTVGLIGPGAQLAGGAIIKSSIVGLGSTALATGAGELLAGEDANPTLIYTGGRLASGVWNSFGRAPGSIAQNVLFRSPLTTLSTSRALVPYDPAFAARQAPLSSRFSVRNINWRAVRGMAAGAAASLLINVDAEPVRAEFPIQIYSNYLLALHEENNDASIREYCYLEEDPEVCSGEIKLGGVCDDDSHSGCLYMTAIPDSQLPDYAGYLGGYQLFAFMNNQAASEQSREIFFKSIFDPNTEPLSQSDYTRIFEKGLASGFREDGVNGQDYENYDEDAGEVAVQAAQNQQALDESLQVEAEPA
ncbi:MAG: carboxypeptidase regulatory-like domain-containing protein [Candidatus Micrarchaeia archaeon]